MYKGGRLRPSTGMSVARYWSVGLRIEVSESLLAEPQSDVYVRSVVSARPWDGLSTRILKTVLACCAPVCAYSDSPAGNLDRK